MPHNNQKTKRRVMELSTRLRRARIKKNLTLRDVENLSKGKISNPYVSLLERGIDRSPHPMKLRVLSQILNISITELFILAGYLKKSELGYSRNEQ
jgi:transcriptional regulator with XRE-family HTH domain